MIAYGHRVPIQKVGHAPRLHVLTRADESSFPDAGRIGRQADALPFTSSPPLRPMRIDAIDGPHSSQVPLR